MASETVEAAVGAEFQVRLRSTPTTGYVWQVQSLSGGVELLGSDFASSADTRPGDSGVHTFRFRAAEAGQHKIELVLKRQWEAAGTATHTVTVKAN